MEGTTIHITKKADFLRFESPLLLYKERCFNLLAPSIAHSNTLLPHR